MALRIASALFAVVAFVVMIASLPLMFASLFAFDAPGSGSSPSAWAMFLTLLSTPLLAFAPGAVALSNIASRSPRMLLPAWLLLALPGGTVAYTARSVIRVAAPPPVCVAQPANGPPLIQDARCPPTRRPQRSRSASSSDPA